MTDAPSSMDLASRVTNEKCWVLVGQRQGPFCIGHKMQPTEGAPTRVEFDHDWVIRRDESSGDIIGFLHTHPSGSLEPSQRDVDTMQAWTSCLGKSLVCLIQCDAEIVGFTFVDDNCTGQPVAATQLFRSNQSGNFPVDDLVVMFDPKENTDNESVDG